MLNSKIKNSKFKFCFQIKETIRLLSLIRKLAITLVLMAGTDNRPKVNPVTKCLLGYIVKTN